MCAKVFYLGPRTMHTINETSTPSGTRYIFDLTRPTEVTNEEDIAWFKKRGGFRVQEGPKEKIKGKVKGNAKEEPAKKEK